MSTFDKGTVTEIFCSTIAAELTHPIYLDRITNKTGNLNNWFVHGRVNTVAMVSLQVATYHIHIQFKLLTPQV